MYELYDENGDWVFSSGNTTLDTGLTWAGSSTCGNDLQLVWHWSPEAVFSDPDIMDPSVIIDEATDLMVTVAIQGQPGCTASASITVSPAEQPEAGADSSIFVCPEGKPFALMDQLDGSPRPGGVWTNAQGDTVPPVFDPGTGVAGEYIYTLIDSEGCIDSALLDIGFLLPDDPLCEPDGMEEPGGGVVHIFPVPTEETIWLVASDRVHRIEIHDARGRLLGTPPWAGLWPMTISMKLYACGTYTVTVHLASGLIRGRIVKL